jgi:hypothetical protein
LNGQARVIGSTGNADASKIKVRIEFSNPAREVQAKHVRRRHFPRAERDWMDRPDGSGDLEGTGDRVVMGGALLSRSDTVQVHSDEGIANHIGPNRVRASARTLALLDILPSATPESVGARNRFSIAAQPLACTRLLDHLVGEYGQIRAGGHRQPNVTFTAYISPRFQLLSKAASVGPQA